MYLCICHCVYVWYKREQVQMQHTARQNISNLWTLINIILLHESFDLKALMLSNLNSYFEKNVNKSDLFLFNTLYIKNSKYIK